MGKIFLIEEILEKVKGCFVSIISAKFYFLFLQRKGYLSFVQIIFNRRC
jgi:hypothetical protein